ncbi:MAG: hypothetical protein MJY95_08500 [Bacteroidaceae bacterium]|nr:hypothetical protein [Bacteroidaceae bacterium]
MNKSEDILSQLQGLHPQIDNADDFADMIISKLPDNKPAREFHIPSTILRVVGTISSIAAVWLVGLFVYTNYETSSTAKPISVGQFSKPYQCSTLENVYTYCKDKQHNKFSYSRIMKQINETNY